ncbi:MAG TPA: murein biosynthesis integral membrane protein MurJ [Gammaproteobacteria bacterium]|nr:murein biosynthesis integral membrane protein MurJ [Gammaproteobacteria bacterium]
MTAANDPQPPKTSLLRASGTVSFMTLISRISGFIRDIVVTRLFGADAATDAFYVAFRIPNFFRRLSAEGSFTQAFIPVLSEYRQRGDAAALRDLISHVTGVLGGILLIFTTLGIAAAPLVILIFAPGVKEPELATHMLRITFPYLFFISLVALAGGIMNSFRHFAVAALTPVWLNICMIGGALWLSRYMDPPIMSQAWAALIAGIVQLLFQVPFLTRMNMLPRPRWRWSHEGVQKILRLMMPSLFGSSVMQINLLIDTIAASLLAAGSITWLYLADRMVEFPLGIFGIAIATVILPSLSDKHAARDAAAFSRNLDWALRLTLLIGIPACLGLALLAEPLMTVLFQNGKFDPHDALMSAYALIAYAFGLPAFMLTKILAPGFYARQDTRTPVYIGIIAMVTKLLMLAASIPLLLHYRIQEAHAALALATSLSAWQQSWMLFRRLHKEAAYNPASQWGRFSLQLLIAAATLIALLWVITPDSKVWDVWPFWQRGLALGALVSGGGLVYFLALWLSGVRFAHFRDHH